MLGVESKTSQVNRMRVARGEALPKIMLARYYVNVMTRLLSVDPAMESTVAVAPQTWNRYTYSLNSPIELLDPDGRVVESSTYADTGPNRVANPRVNQDIGLDPAQLATLGTKLGNRGAVHLFNVTFTVSAGDSPANYRVKAWSYAFKPGSQHWLADTNAKHGRDDPEPDNQARLGQDLVAFDGPGHDGPGGVTQAQSAGANAAVQYAMKFQAFTIGPKRRGGRRPSGRPVYLLVTVKITNGKAVGLMKEITKAEFKTYVRKWKASASYTSSSRTYQSPP